MTSVHTEQDVLMQEEPGTERQANYEQNKPQEQGQQVKEQVQEITQKAKGMLDENKDRFVQRLSKVEHALREVSQRLRDDQEQMLSDYGNRLADGITRIERSLESKDASGFLREVEDFSRRSPFVVVSVALLAGLLIGRVLKSSGR